MPQKSRPSRSEIMRAVKSKDTTPELIVRRLVHSLGYRYRLHGEDLPGKPDLVFASRRKVCSSTDASGTATIAAAEPDSP